MVTYGGMSRQPVIAPTSSLIFNNIQLKGFWMTRWNMTQPLEERVEMLTYLSNLALTGKWTPPEHKLIPFAKYRDGLANAMKGYSGVKYIITFD
jgi:mitochondrial enoyl-[acyl-carrier protein] reductase / trans-2-enoyl-CoA reductase